MYRDGELIEELTKDRILMQYHYDPNKAIEVTVHDSTTGHSTHYDAGNNVIGKMSSRLDTKTGEYQRFHTNGKIIEEYDGKDTYKIFHDNGNLKQILKNGGYCELYDENGSLIQENEIENAGSVRYQMYSKDGKFIKLKNGKYDVNFAKILPDDNWGYYLYRLNKDGETYDLWEEYDGWIYGMYTKDSQGSNYIYQSSDNDGDYKLYDEDDNVIQEGNINKLVKPGWSALSLNEGNYKRYKSEGGRRILTEEGNKNGDYKLYDEDGILTEEGNAKDGDYTLYYVLKEYGDDFNRGYVSNRSKILREKGNSKTGKYELYDVNGKMIQQDNPHSNIGEDANTMDKSEQKKGDAMNTSVQNNASSTRNKGPSYTEPNSRTEDGIGDTPAYVQEPLGPPESNADLMDYS